MKKTPLFFLIFCLIFGGCSIIPPAVFKNQTAASAVEDREVCHKYALSKSGGTPVNTLGSLLTWGSVGAAFGAVLGAISGNPLDGAILFGSLFGGGGAIASTIDTETLYNKAFEKCLIEKGWTEQK